MSNNQLDHILVDEKIFNCSFVTSYFNFISDHKSVVFRFGGEGNRLTNEALEKINFKREDTVSINKFCNNLGTTLRNIETRCFFLK